MPLVDSHLEWDLGGSDVRNFALVNDKTNKEVVFNRPLVANYKGCLLSSLKGTIRNKNKCSGKRKLFFFIKDIPE